MENFVQIVSKDERTRCEYLGSVFYIRRLDDDTKHRLRLEHMKDRAPSDPRDAADQERKYADAMFDYLLLDWEGVMGPVNMPVPCTPENKRMLPRAVKNYLIGKAAWVNTQSWKREKKDTKNLSDTPASKEPSA